MRSLSPLSSYVTGLSSACAGRILPRQGTLLRDFDLDRPGRSRYHPGICLRSPPLHFSGGCERTTCHADESNTCVSSLGSPAMGLLAPWHGGRESQRALYSAGGRGLYCRLRSSPRPSSPGSEAAKRLSRPLPDPTHPWGGGSGVPSSSPACGIGSGGIRAPLAVQRKPSTRLPASCPSRVALLSSSVWLLRHLSCLTGRCLEHGGARAPCPGL